MGANFDYNIIPDPELKMTNTQIQTEVKKVFKQSTYDHGHAGYSGTLAEKDSYDAKIHRTKQFDTIEQAEDYVMDNLDNDKWGPADVVAVKGTGWFLGGWCSS